MAPLAARAGNQGVERLVVDPAADPLPLQAGGRLFRLVGVGGVMIPLQSFVTPRIFGPAVVGRASGLLSFVTLCGLLVMPPLFGFIFDRTGGYSAIFIAVAALAALATLLVPRIRLHPRGATAEAVAAALST